jgi:hypothetical protein
LGRIYKTIKMCIYLIIFHMSAIWESANWTRQFGIRQTGNRQFGMLPARYSLYLVYFRINGKHLLVQNTTVLTRQF